MKNLTCRYFFLVLACLWSAFSWAQEKTPDSLSVSAKIDSIYKLQKKMYKEIKNEPLLNKKFGIEFNFARLLLMEKAVNLSGGFSIFSINRHAEIAFPIYYSNPNDPKELNELTIDCHFRYFLGNTQNGFYLSGFTRFAHLEGYSGENDQWLWDGPSTNSKTSENKFGIGVGIGFRKFSYTGLYWGFSFSLGRYIIGENDIFYGEFIPNDDDGKYIFDVELLKFGWAF